MKPNHVTCSILLKSIQARSSITLINRVSGVIDTVVYEMDEVLMSSVIEAFIRINRSDLLLHVLKKWRTRHRIEQCHPAFY